MRAALIPALALAGTILAPGGAGAAPSGLVAVAPRSPWTLRELQAAHADIVSYDPDTGIAYVVATAADQQRLAASGFAVATVEPDVDKGLRRLQGDPNLGLYHTYAETVADMESLQARYPNRCKLAVLGQTLEGRDILALKISDDPAFDDPDEPDVLIVGCHHAREFMSVEVPLYTAHWLLENYGIGPLATHLVDSRETWIVPMVNPDGHVYQENFQASPEWIPPGWRKNRRPNLDGTIGVDLNRNYGFQWGYDDVGSSPDGTNETYRGQGPFSELETQAIRALVQQQRFVVSITYHSFGRLMLYPWGYTDNELTDDQAVFAALADSLVRSNGYRPGNAYYGTIYLTNGEMNDWMYGDLTPQKPTRTFGFTAEMNSAGEGGFWPPESLIGPTCAAMLPANLFLISTADNVTAPLPPPRPLLTAVQNPSDRRHIHLSWSQPVDPGNPVDHYEVFEIAVAASAAGAPATLAHSGRAQLAHHLPRPGSGAIVVRLTTDLEPLWDYAYVEARGDAGDWVTLRGEVTCDASPTGRNRGRGITGRMPAREVRFALDEVAGTNLDLALRLDAYGDTPRPARIGASLDAGATFSEERRVLDPNVHGTEYDVVAERGGLFAYGVTAVDMQGQKTDSDIFFFSIPVVPVEVHDVELTQDGRHIVLRWQSAATGPARFEAWMRSLRPGEVPGDAAAEWSHVGWSLAAAVETAGSGPTRLEWDVTGGAQAIVLRSRDADGDRLWGPWRVEVVTRTRLAPAVPNPFNPSTTLTYQLARAADVRLEIFTADGHRVRTLAVGHLGPGERRVNWDGRDDAGHAVGSGVYWARLRADATTDAQKLVLLR